MSLEVRPLAAGLETAAARRERLRLALPMAAELLRTRQAGRISSGDIDDFVELNWLEWDGGTLRLTITGSNVCSQMTHARRG